MSVKYTFYHLSHKEPAGLCSKMVQEHLLKLSMKKCVHINYYAFNQEFIPDDIEQFAWDFFRNDNVTISLQTSLSGFIGKNVSKIQTEEIPCNITSMTFFDKLIDPKNNIVYSGTDKNGNHTIRQCMEVYKNGIYLNNNLKMMLFEEECSEYFVYEEDERVEFMFRLLKHFVIGGRWCQDDIVIEPYLNTTKHVYKDLLTVEKLTSSKLQISSKMYKVIVFDSNDTVLFPKEHNKSVPFSFAYIAVNQKTRTVALFFHNVGDKIYT